MNLLFSILGCTLSLGGNILLIFKKRIAFWIWSLGNLAWVISALVGELNVPLIAMNVAYIIINIIGWIKWSKQRSKE